jgi:hypothetical protein
MTFAIGGKAARVKLEDGVTVRVLADVALCVPTMTVKGPVPAPAGITKAMLVAVNELRGASRVPPPC